MHAVEVIEFELAVFFDVFDGDEPFQCGFVVGVGGLGGDVELVGYGPVGGAGAA